MVLSEELTSEVRFGVLGKVLKTIHTWLQGLSRPEDINDVDEDGTTVLGLHHIWFAQGADTNDKLLDRGAVVAQARSRRNNCRSTRLKPRGSGASPESKCNAESCAAKAAEKTQHEAAKLSGDEKFYARPSSGSMPRKAPRTGKKQLRRRVRLTSLEQ